MERRCAATTCVLDMHIQGGLVSRFVLTMTLASSSFSLAFIAYRERCWQETAWPLWRRQYLPLDLLAHRT